MKERIRTREGWEWSVRDKEREGQRGRESHFGKCVEASGSLGVVALFGLLVLAFARWLTAYHLAVTAAALVLQAISCPLRLYHEPSSLQFPLPFCRSTCRYTHGDFNVRGSPEVTRRVISRRNIFVATGHRKKEKKKERERSDPPQRKKGGG